MLGWVVGNGLMTRLRILHLEDDDTDALLIERGLNAAFGRGNVVVIRTRSARETEAYLARETVDLLLLDLNLPDVYSLDEAIVRARHLSDAPIIVVSDQSDGALQSPLIRDEIEMHLEKAEFGDAHHLARCVRPLLREFGDAPPPTAQAS